MRVKVATTVLATVVAASMAHPARDWQAGRRLPRVFHSRQSTPELATVAGGAAGFGERLDLRRRRESAWRQSAGRPIRGIVLATLLFLLAGLLPVLQPAVARAQPPSAAQEGVRGRLITEAQAAHNAGDHELAQELATRAAAIQSNLGAPSWCSADLLSFASQRTPMPSPSAFFKYIRAKPTLKRG